MLRAPTCHLARAAAVPLVAAVLLVGCGGDDEDSAAAPAATTPVASTPAPTSTVPAETQPAPAETQPKEEPAAPAESEAPEKAAAPATDAGKDESLDGAAEAAATSLRAQLAGDYPTVKALVTKRCGKQVTKASVEQMAAAFDAMSKKAEQAKLKAVLDKLSTPDGWTVKAAGDGTAKVTAKEEAGFSDYYFVREDGTWRDDTCARQQKPATGA